MNRARKQGAVVVGVGDNSTSDDAVDWAAAEAATRRGYPLRVVLAFHLTLPTDPQISGTDSAAMVATGVYRYSRSPRVTTTSGVEISRVLAPATG